VALYQNKYRIDSLRLAQHDYSAPGEYFITICTKDKICHLGKVVNGEMHLSPVGLIVQEEWEKSGRVRVNLQLDAFVVMPNHIHGMIVICKSLVETTGGVVSTMPINRGVISSLAETTHRVVSTGNKPTSTTLQPNSLGSIVGQVKSVCTKRIHAAGYRDFGWQSGYYDHVIRDEKDLNRIREYIAMNPSRWDLDDEFAHNIGMDPVHREF
jgi:REP element-mobilizing transposase RayT